MRLSQISCVIAIMVSGCAAISPKSSQELSDAPPEAVVERRFYEAVPVRLAYRNALEKARECWQQTGGFPFVAAWFVDADPYDPDVGYARIAVRVSGLVVTVVNLRPTSTESTDIVARAIKMSGGHHLSHRDLPYLGDWAAARPAKCQDRVLF